LPLNNFIQIRDALPPKFKHRARTDYALIDKLTTRCSFFLGTVFYFAQRIQTEPTKGVISTKVNGLTTTFTGKL